MSIAITAIPAKKSNRKAKTTKKSDAGKRPEAKASKGKTSKKPDAKKAPPKKAGGEGEPGVIGSIVEFLKAASEKKPLSKKALLAKLQERFPDRTETAMMRTINCQVPSRLRKEKELTVTKNEHGYWAK